MSMTNTYELPTLARFITLSVVSQNNLFLKGDVNTIARVWKGTTYRCQMYVTQPFGHLMNHYTEKYGLRIEDLTFVFTDELCEDETPESVHMTENDEILVYYREQARIGQVKNKNTNTFEEALLSIVNDKAYSDISFYFPNSDETLWAHKAILSSRSEHFNSLIKSTLESTISITSCTSVNFLRVLQYIYSNNIINADKLSINDLIDLLKAAAEYNLSNLKVLCCELLGQIPMTADNIVDLATASYHYGVDELKVACASYIRRNYFFLKQANRFNEDVRSRPELRLLVLEAMTLKFNCIPNVACDESIEKESKTSPGEKRLRRSTRYAYYWTLAPHTRESSVAARLLYKD